MKTKTFKQLKTTLVDFILQPQFEELIKDVETYPVKDRFECSKDLTKIEALQQRGINIPDGIELKVRKKSTNNLLAGGWSVCVNLGPISVCYAF
jgi:hypothetical protein